MGLLSTWFGRRDPAPATPEAIALAIVNDLAPSIRAAMMAGIPLEAIRAELHRTHKAQWLGQSFDVYRHTVNLLERLGPMAFLTPRGWEVEGLTSLDPSRRKRRRTLS